MLEERLRRRTAILCFSASLLLCYSVLRCPNNPDRKKVPRNTRDTAFEIPLGRLDNLMSRSCLLTRRIKQSGRDEMDEINETFGYEVTRSDRLVRSLAELPDLSQLVGSSVDSFFAQFVDAPFFCLRVIFPFFLFMILIVLCLH